MDGSQPLSGGADRAHPHLDNNFWGSCNTARWLIVAYARFVRQTETTTTFVRSAPTPD